MLVTPAFQLLSLNQQLVDHLSHHPVGFLPESGVIGSAVHLPVVRLRIVDNRLWRGVDRHHRHGVQRFQVEYAHHLAHTGDWLEHSPALEILAGSLPLRRQDEVAIRLVEDVHVDGIAGGRGVLDTTADDLAGLIPELDDALLAIDFDAQFHVTEVVFEESLWVVFPEVAHVSGVPLFPGVQFPLADRVQSIRLQLGEHGPLVGVQ